MAQLELWRYFQFLSKESDIYLHFQSIFIQIILRKGSKSDNLFWKVLKIGKCLQSVAVFRRRTKKINRVGSILIYFEQNIMGTLELRNFLKETRISRRKFNEFCIISLPLLKTLFWSGLKANSELKFKLFELLVEFPKWGLGKSV